MMRLYVSGPIAADREGAPKRFSNACTRLNLAGYLTVNPFDCQVIHMYDCDCFNTDEDRTYICNMRGDIKAMMDCDAVALLPGWEDSKGCKVEVELAKGMKMVVDTLENWINLEKAPAS